VTESQPGDRAAVVGWLARLAHRMGRSRRGRTASVEWPAYHPFRSAEAKAEYLAYYDGMAERWPIAAECRNVATSYGQTFVRVSGPENAAPLVLLPGASSTSLSWLLNIEALSRSHRTYAVDNICDFGRSVYRRPIHGPAGYVNWLEELLAALELGDDTSLAGFSFGGWLAALCALRLAARLKKVVLLAPGATVLPIRGELWLRLILSRLPHPCFARSFTRWLLAGENDSGRAPPDEGANHMLLARRCFKPRRPVMPTVLADQELRSIRVSTLFLVGELEKMYSPQEAVRRLNTVAPHIETEIVPDAGHNLVYAQREMVSNLVLRFLKKP
jgi:pimeloyl-ACP methyl ester carboxylesterase